MAGSIIQATVGDGVSGLPKVIFLAIAEAEGEGGKTSALKVKAEGEGEGWVFCNYVFDGHIQT